MELKLTLLVSAALVLAFTDSGSSLKCSVCPVQDAATQPGLPCIEDIDCLAPGDNRGVCYTEALRVAGGETKISRGCSQYGLDATCAEVRKLAEYFGNTQLNCTTCNTDRCNSASRN